MTPSQLDDSLNAPWTRTIVGLVSLSAWLGAEAISTATPESSRAARLNGVETLRGVLTCQVIVTIPPVGKRWDTVQASRRGSSSSGARRFARPADQRRSGRCLESITCQLL